MVLVDVPLMLYKNHIVQPLFLICNSMLVKSYNAHFRSECQMMLEYVIFVFTITLLVYCGIS